MGRTHEQLTTVSLQGERAKDYLQTRGMNPVGCDGNFLLGETSGHAIHSSVGLLIVSFGVVIREHHRNLEVTLDDPAKRFLRRGKRSISVGPHVELDHVLWGKQQFTKGVDLVVFTSVPQEVFERNKR